MDWRARFDEELARAERARTRGNEGQARVCARRAAGLVAVEFLERQGLAPRSRSAVDALKDLMLSPALSPELIPPVGHLLQQVSTEFKLPPGIDLIAEARRLQQALLPE